MLLTIWRPKIFVPLPVMNLRTPDGIPMKSGKFSSLERSYFFAARNVIALF